MAMLTFMLSRPSTRSVALGAAVVFAGDGFGSQSFVEKKFSDATDAWDRSERTKAPPAGSSSNVHICSSRERGD